MFIGHFAVALAAKRAAPKISLGTLFLSSQFIDLLWPLFLLLGIEHVRIEPGNTAFTPLDFYDYPVTHSFVATIGWSVALGAAYFAVRCETRTAMVVALSVLSHWILDFLSHRPDLPLGFGGDIFLGLGLWNSIAATIVVEGTLFVMGIGVYLRATAAKDRVGVIGFWSLIVVLAAIYGANIFGAPPPNETAIAFAGNALWLFVVWAYWVERHRASVDIPNQLV